MSARAAAMTEAAVSPGLGAGLWPRVRRFGPTRLVLLAVAILAFAYLWIEADGRFPESTVWQVPLVLELLFLSVLWRTVSARTVVRYFFIGFGPIFLATVITQTILIATPLHGWLQDLSTQLLLSGVGSLGAIELTIWAPISEEIWKIVPVIVLAWWGRSHLRSQGGPLDFAILAAAVGAGLGMAEDLFQLGGVAWTTPASPILGLGIGTVYLVLVNVINAFPIPVVVPDLDYQGIVGILNPSVEELQSGAIWAGHGVLPMLVGLALGFAVLGRRRFGPLVYVLPVLALLWAIWDHFVANWYSSVVCSGADPYGLCTMAGFTLNGALLPLVAIAAWLVAMLVSRRAVARHTGELPELALARPQITTKAHRGSGPTWPLRFAADLLHYLVLRGRSAFGGTQYERSSKGKRSAEADALVAVRLQEASLAARLRGDAVPQLPAAVRHRATRLTSRL
jgi:hypothetical protein